MSVDVEHVGTNETLEGLPISPGLAMGPAYIYRDILKRENEYYGTSESEAAEESKRIDNAIASGAEGIGLYRTELKERIRTR